MTPSRYPAEETEAAYDAFYGPQLSGSWSSAEYSACPIDLAVHFNPDGTGGYMKGLGEKASDFMWRQSGEFVIEVRRFGENTWIKVEYGFSLSNKQEVEIGFMVLEQSPDWVRDLEFADMALSRIALPGSSPPEYL